MKGLHKICTLVNHYSKNICFVCAHKLCNTSRFMCVACIFDGIHKHDLLDCNHILDQQGFCDMIQNSLLESLDQYAKKQLNLDLLKQILSQIGNRVTDINNFISNIEQGKIQNNDYYQQVEEQLQNIQNFGFNHMDTQQLDKLIMLRQNQQQQQLDITLKLRNDVELLMKNAQSLNEWQMLFIDLNHQQQIRNANYTINQVDKMEQYFNRISSCTISYDFKYIVSGQYDKKLKIWNYENYNLMMEKNTSDKVTSCKFTEDSTVLYAGTISNLYQYDVNSNFEQINIQKIGCDSITQIYCISNTIILISSSDKHIIKIDFNKKQLIFKIKAYYDKICGLDYNRQSNIIASGSNDGINLWDGSFGKLQIHKQDAYINNVRQILFINNDQLISLDYSYIIFWNINYQTYQLDQLQLIKASGIKIQLVLNQQYILVIGQKFIKVYSINGQYLRQLDHNIDQSNNTDFDAISLDTMKAILIYNGTAIEICKIEIQ